MKALGKVFYILILLFVCSWQAQAKSANDQAKEALNLGRVAAAADILNKQVQAKPDDYQAWFLLGVAQARSQHFHQAIEAFRRVIELRDDLAEPHNNLAVIYNELGDVKSAVHELEQSLQKHPGYGVAEENIADLYIKLALQYYKKALVENADPALAQRYARLLQVRDSRGKASAPRAVGQASVATKVVKTTPKPSTKHEVLDEKAIVADAGVVTNEADKVVTKVSARPLPKQVNEEVADNRAVVDAHQPKEDILAALEAWRVAWQTQDLNAYFSAYASDYVPTGRYASLSAWKAYKKRVIGNKTYIKVDLSNIKVELSENGKVAHIRFNQAFHSNSYNGDDVKVLKLEKRHEGWKIIREGSVS